MCVWGGGHQVLGLGALAAQRAHSGGWGGRGGAGSGREQEARTAAERCGAAALRERPRVRFEVHQRRLQ